ncbi:MAG TPA: GNAT family N-acetyltransferase [Beutenbergiaceae bacterium]|nr:GNAT family N-acetyltransferase [Beutenbergiaceae bacterium]
MTGTPPTQLGQLELEDETLPIMRAAQPDVPAIVGLLTDDVLGQGREADPDDQSYQQAFAAIDADPNQLLLVALTGGGQIAATAQLTFIPGLSRGGALRAQVEAVRVAASHRGQGLGEAFFTWMIEYCTARGAAILQLTTDRQRTDAVRFYERLGFVVSHHGLKLTLGQ